MPVHRFTHAPCVTAMLVLKAVEREERINPQWVMADLANRLGDELGASRATIFRYVRSAVDVLGIHYQRGDQRPWYRRQTAGARIV